MSIKKSILKLVTAVVTFIVLALVIKWALYPDESPTWTGFGSYKPNPKVERSKTLWDWLDLLLVPVIVAMGAWFLSKSESDLDRKREAERFEHDNLSSYLSLMTSLLLERGIKYENKIEERSVARTQSLRIIKIVSKNKKAQILQFLYESGLLSINPIVNLNGGDLSKGNYENVILVGAELRGVFFNGASLQNSRLDKANLAGSNFNSADLSKALVDSTNFEYADFKNAKIKKVDLTAANIQDADFTNSDLSDSLVTPEQFTQIENWKVYRKPKLMS